MTTVNLARHGRNLPQCWFAAIRCSSRKNASAALLAQKEFVFDRYFFTLFSKEPSMLSRTAMLRQTLPAPLLRNLTVRSSVRFGMD